MIVGAVNVAREAVVSLRVRGPAGGDLTSDAVIDTGFNGYITLPAAVIAALGLTTQGVRSGVLGDETRTVFTVYRAAVEWDGTARPVQVLAAEGSPLIGMALLLGSRVSVEFVTGGAVTIEPMP